MKASACIVVPIKTANERLPGKNTKSLKGKPLYTYLFNTLRHVPEVEAVFVDSSDEDVLNIASDWGFSRLKRPEAFNSNSITGNELLVRIAEELHFDIIGQLHVTTPFLSRRTIQKAITILKVDPEVDSVFGVIPRYNRFWFKGIPVNHKTNRLIRTQDLVPIYEESDFYFVRRTSFLRYNTRVCGKRRALEVSRVESVDIDTIEDFVYAEMLLDMGLVEY